MEDNLPLQDETPETVESPGKSYAPARITIIIFAILIASTSLCAYKWYKSEQFLDWVSQTKNFTIADSYDGSITSYHWKRNGLTANLWMDDNHDGNNEKSIMYDFNGNKLFETFDDNEDGYSEYSLMYDTTGNVVQEVYDLDQDGYYERTVVYSNGLKIESKDIDFDTHHDSLYVYRGKKQINTIPVTALDNFLINYSADSLLWNH